MQKSSELKFVANSTTPKRFLPLVKEDLNTIHDATMAVLGKVGVRFASENALNKFKNHGFRVDGQQVFFKEVDILKALETVPNQVTVLARNPKHNLKSRKNNKNVESTL